jgi:hypothetical protein
MRRRQRAPSGRLSIAVRRLLAAEGKLPVAENHRADEDPDQHEAQA